MDRHQLWEENLISIFSVFYILLLSMNTSVFSLNYLFHSHLKTNITVNLQRYYAPLLFTGFHGQCFQKWVTRSFFLALVWKLCWNLSTTGDPAGIWNTSFQHHGNKQLPQYDNPTGGRCGSLTRKGTQAMEVRAPNLNHQSWLNLFFYLIHFNHETHINWDVVVPLWGDQCSMRIGLFLVLWSCPPAQSKYRSFEYFPGATCVQVDFFPKVS